MCPTTGISYDEPAPNLFSFNSPYGACSSCNGLGTIEEFTEKSIILDDNLSIEEGGITPFGKYRKTIIFTQIERILEKYKESISTPINQLDKNTLKGILWGDEYEYFIKGSGGTLVPYFEEFEGVIPMMTRFFNNGAENVVKTYQDFLHKQTCPSCQGARLKKEALFFKIHDKNIAELAQLDLSLIHI